LEDLSNAKSTSKRSCCSRFWAVLTSPFVWIYNKIAGCFNKISTCWKNVFYDPHEFEDDEVVDNATSNSDAENPEKTEPNTPTNSPAKSDDGKKPNKKVNETDTTKKTSKKDDDKKKSGNSTIPSTARLKEEVLSFKDEVDRLGKTSGGNNEPLLLKDLEKINALNARLRRLESSKQTKDKELERLIEKPDADKTEAGEKLMAAFVSDIETIRVNLEQCEKDLKAKFKESKDSILKDLQKMQKVLTERFTPVSSQNEAAAKADDATAKSDAATKDIAAKLEDSTVKSDAAVRLDDAVVKSSAATKHAQAAPKRSIDSDDKAEFERYVRYLANIEKFGWKDAVDSKMHSDLIKAKKVAYKELQGFENVGNTCWMNAGLQALFALKQIRNAIKSDIKPNIENELEVKHRLEKDPKRVAETDAEFLKRVTRIENTYPVPRTKEIQKMFFDARMGIHVRSKPVQNDGEEGRNFETRLKEHAARAPKLEKEEDRKKFLDRLQKNGIRERTDPKREATCIRAEKITKKDKEFFLNPRLAETDAEFAIRQKPNVESNDDFEQRKKCHEILRSLLNAWEEGEPLKHHLEKLRSFLAEINAVEFVKGKQNCTAAFTGEVMKVLGLPVYLAERIKVGEGANEKTHDFIPTNRGLVGINLNQAKEGIDARSLILETLAERANTDKSEKYKRLGTYDYRVSHRLMNIPEVLPIHFERRFAITKFDNERITKMQNAAKLAAECNEEEAYEVDAALAGLGGLIDKKTNINLLFLGMEMDFTDTDIFDSGIRGANKIIYRIKSFTVHDGNERFGHYIGYRLCEDGVWRYYSDGSVHVLEEKEFGEALAQAYTLFLERVVT
jgi:hypothetical protein